MPWVAETETSREPDSRPERPRATSRKSVGSCLSQTKFDPYFLQELLATRAEATAVLDPVLWSLECLRLRSWLALLSSRSHRLLALLPSLVFWQPCEFCQNSARAAARSPDLTAMCQQDFRAQFGACVTCPRNRHGSAWRSRRPGYARETSWRTSGWACDRLEKSDMLRNL